MSRSHFKSGYAAFARIYETLRGRRPGRPPFDLELDYWLGAGMSMVGRVISYNSEMLLGGTIKLGRTAGA